MALTDVYVQTLGQIKDLFREIKQGQAPSQFTTQHLKDLGFTSSNHRLFLPLLKALGFLTADGKPTPRYHDYRSDDQTARRVLGQGMKEAYRDLFVLRAKPTENDKVLFEGKFKSAHNTTDRMAKLMASTFFSLLPLADLDDVATPAPPPRNERSSPLEEEKLEVQTEARKESARRTGTSLHYNIQIHLPATKDIEVYNAIFRSLKEHLLE
ncbi:DUF5343 domain-containing protein [Variovorax sp. 160MFSha2.1]|uniref:DUF5343 domain-containing protein n=1 Tax=Variovorax sp. 160MFSha2.1 TaxID=3158367 RepID=UPI003AAC2A34